MYYWIYEWIIFKAINVYFLKKLKVGQMYTKKWHMHHGTSCKITTLTEKICGNESKICMTSQNYELFQCIFQLFYIYPHLQAGEKFVKKMLACQTSLLDIKMSYT